MPSRNLCRQRRLQVCDQGGKKTDGAATDRALAAEGRTAHADAEAGTPLPMAPGIEKRESERLALAEEASNLGVRLGCCLTSDVRGGPLAGRPLDGAVRRTRLSKGMTRTRNLSRRKRVAWRPGGTTLTGGDFEHLGFRVRLCQK